MKHVLTCLVVALACTLFLTYPTYAEEITSEVEIVDFSGNVKDGGEVVKAVPSVPAGDNSQFTQAVWKPLMERFYRFDIHSNGVSYYDEGWIENNSQTIFNKIVFFLTFMIPIIIGLVFLWWGIRKTVAAIMSAFKKGKLRI